MQGVRHIAHLIVMGHQDRTTVAIDLHREENVHRLPTWIHTLQQQIDVALVALKTEEETKAAIGGDQDHHHEHCPLDATHGPEPRPGRDGFLDLLLVGQGRRYL